MSTILDKKPTEELANIIRRLGNPASTILLNASSLIFRIPDVDGIIGYQRIKNCAVVIGDPICLPQDISLLIQAFHIYCQEAHLSIVYLLASDAFAHWLLDNGCRTLIQSGELLSLDPTGFRIKQKLRWKINQSINLGVTVKESHISDPGLENQMKTAIDTWSKTKQGPQLYLGSLDLFSNDANRIFYAALEEKIVGLLALWRIDQFQGWVVTIFFALPETPVGITEHLMTSAFEALAAENCHFMCLGAVSGSKLGEILGLNMISRFFTHFIFNASRRFFQFDSKKRYFDKYHPHYQQMYVVFSGKLGINELLALKEILHISF